MDKTKDTCSSVNVGTQYNKRCMDMSEAVENENSNVVVQIKEAVEETVSTPSPIVASTPTEKPEMDMMVWLPATGEKYHNKND